MIFPEVLFTELLNSACKLFPPPASNDSIYDEDQKWNQFVFSSDAVKYRYRKCQEDNTEFKNVFATASELWINWNEGEENYQVDKCLYSFFTNGLSIFESFGFCLYFIAGMMKPKEFIDVREPKKITLNKTTRLFNRYYSDEIITIKFHELLEDDTFREIEKIRNILAHRIISRRSIVSNHDKINAFLYLPGLDKTLVFNENLIQPYFDKITYLLTELISASIKFLALGIL